MTHFFKPPATMRTVVDLSITTTSEVEAAANNAIAKLEITKEHRDIIYASAASFSVSNRELAFDDGLEKYQQQLITLLQRVLNTLGIEADFETAFKNELSAEARYPGL